MDEIYKPIDHIWISLTSKCNLNCEYCCVLHNNSVISLDDAKKSINLLFSDNTFGKNLFFFGGEPLLEFNLLKQTVIYATSEAKRKGIILENVFIFTNGLLLKDEMIAFIQNYNIKIFVSILGSNERHNKYRSQGIKPTYDILEHNLKKLNILGENLVLFLTVHQSNVEYLYQDFLYFINKGFRNFDICSLQSSGWTLEKFKILKKNYIRILKQIYSNIKHNNFIYLNYISRLIHQNFLKDTKLYDTFKNCPLSYKLKVYPDGSLSTDFFEKNKQFGNYIIGTLNEGFDKKFKSCTFDQSSKICRECFLNLEETDKSHQFDFQNNTSLNIESQEFSKRAQTLFCDGDENLFFAKKLFENSHIDPHFKKYMIKMKNRGI